MTNKSLVTMLTVAAISITQENFTAGGVLAGKSYQDIEPELARFNYQKL